MNNYINPRSQHSRPKQNTKYNYLNNITTSYANNSNSKTNFNSKSYSTNQNKNEQAKIIQDMFLHIHMNVNQLVQNLNYIYQSNGIYYDFSIFVDAIIRLITPVELLFQITNKSYKTVNSQQARHKNVQRKHVGMKLGKKQYVNTSEYPPYQNTNKGKNLFSKQNSKNQQESAPESLKYLDIQVNNQTQVQAQQNYYDMGTSRLNEQNASGSRTSLNPQQQQMICAWMQQQVQSGRIVTKTDIMKQAKIISKNPSFLASTGWCRRFLSRNQDARILLQMNRFIPEMQMQIIENARLERSRRFQRHQQKQQEIKLRKQSKQEQKYKQKYWEPVYMNQPFEQIVRSSQSVNRQGNNQNLYQQSEQSAQKQEKAKSKSKHVKNDGSQKQSQTPQFQQIVNKLQYAVRGHNEAMLYPANTKQKINNSLSQYKKKAETKKRQNEEN